jgi:hypothetical protein
MKKLTSFALYVSGVVVALAVVVEQMEGTKSYAQGTDCSMVGGGLYPYANATGAGPYELLPRGSRYELKASLAQGYAPPEGVTSFYFAAQNYQTKKYQLTGKVGWASWFGLGGNWENEMVTVLSTGKWIFAMNGSSYGPDFAYEKRPYEQRYTVSAKKVSVNGGEKWVYCNPCRVRLATLLGAPAMAFEVTEKPDYDPPLQGKSDACALHTLP